MKKLTNYKWLNVFETKKLNGDPYLVVSRKKAPSHLGSENPDAVIIVPYKDTPEGLKLVITQEFRPAIGGYEYGFPAGLLEEGEGYYETAKRELKEETNLDISCWADVLHVSPVIYSSAGMTDESVVMVFTMVHGTPSNENAESDEVIRVFEMSPGEVYELLNKQTLERPKKFGAKGWAIMDNFARTGKIWTASPAKS